MSESEVQVLRSEFQGLEKRLIERLDRVDQDIAEVKGKLDKIDDDIRGNGRVGINVRLDRLEKVKHTALWISGALATAFPSGLFAHHFSLIEKWIDKES